jgi:hypothetical protein
MISRFHSLELSPAVPNNLDADTEQDERHLPRQPLRDSAIAAERRDEHGCRSERIDNW